MNRKFNQTVSSAVKIARLLLSRTAALYVMAVVVLLFVTNFDIGWNHAATSVLSRYMPDHAAMIAFDKDRTKYNAVKWKEFELYYRRVAEFMPDLPDAYAMLGFCYFYEGKIDKAVAEYLRAVRMNSNVFNFYFNLGVLALQSKEDAEALAHFKRSIEVLPMKNLQFVVLSQVYRQFLPHIKVPEDMALAMGNYTRDVYGKAYLEILRIAERQKDYEAMFVYSRQGLANGFLDAGLANYYSGMACYGLKQFENALGYLQESLKQGYHYAQVFEMMGQSLKALGRPESAPAMFAAASLTKDGKILRSDTLTKDLLIY